MQNSSIAVANKYLKTKEYFEEVFVFVTGGFSEFIVSDAAFALKNDPDMRLIGNQDFDLGMELPKLPEPRYLHSSLVMKVG